MIVVGDSLRAIHPATVIIYGSQRDRRIFSLRLSAFEWLIVLTVLGVYHGVLTGSSRNMG